MNYFPLTTEQQEWKERTAEIAERYIGPRAADYDRKAQFPQESLNALREDVSEVLISHQMDRPNS